MIRCPGCGWPIARVLPDRRVELSPVAEAVTLPDGQDGARCWNCGYRIPLGKYGKWIAEAARNC